MRRLPPELDRYGRIPINFIDRCLAYTRFLPINSVFRLGWKSPVLTKINKNDVVLVLPSMYTGSTDFKNSPIGRISGGLYYASLINTVLLNNPIKPVFNGIFSNIILFIIIAYFVWLLSSKLSFTRSVLAITFLSIVIVVLGLVTFAYWNIQSDWHTYSFFAALWGSGLLTMRAAQEERNAQFAEVLLEGIVSKDVLKRIKHRPEIWNLRPIEQSMTVMFIDIEGFSLRTKDLFPVDMFSVLHAQINEISAIVHEHGGIVDRVLGDGMLCFFGFSFDDHKSEVQFDHALRALKCALAVQRSAIELTIQSSPSAMSAGSVLPLRIGLCTGETFIGNMGTDRRLDFTVIGHTVNMAKRYEDACETFRVFMSETTYRELENRNQLHEFFDVMFVQRYMAMKHQLELVLGWECDPFFSNNDGYRAALKKIKPESKDNLQLTKLKPQHTVKIKLNQSSSGVLTWFDMDRYIIETDSYFCRKVNLVAELISDVEDINIQLAVANLKILHFQVNQGQALGQNVYRHELILLNITPEKRKVLLTLLTEGD